MEHFKKLLELAVTNTFFIFDGKYYEQTEGLGMGLPLGPTFANVFLCFHETNWIKDCPDLFRPIMYKRYVDDTFMLFSDPDHPKMFLDYLNSKHPNIKFTMDLENDGKLSFLDLTVERSNGSFVTSVYRKPTFTGLGLSYFSNCSFRFKINSITTLISRAYKLSSSYVKLHSEFKFLRNFFSENGFPRQLIDSQINKFLNKVYSPSSKPDPPKESLYFTLPYFGHQSDKMKRDLTKALSKLYPDYSFQFILVNPFKIGSFFNHKDRIPKCLSSSVVYKFRCACKDAPSYVGMTSRHLFQRVAEHLGISSRTGNPLSTPPFSSIRQHALTCHTSFSESNFSILKSCQNNQDLRIIESLYIRKTVPQLNDSQSSYALLIA